eukprot:jgi/Mesen1/3232/ME000187S02395
MEGLIMEELASPGSLKRGFPDAGSNGREKRPNSGQGPEGMEVIYRLLCPASKTGSVIGKAGSIIKQMRDESGARIKIADAVPGVDERVVIISAEDDPERAWSSAQDGLMRVHARLVELQLSPEDSTMPAGVPMSARLLVPSNQIGCLLGKGGSIIQQMRDETGAQIRVLGQDQVPGCALPSDELLQVLGEVPVVQKALEIISARLRANPPRERRGAFLSSPRGVAQPHHHQQLPHTVLSPGVGGSMSLFPGGMLHSPGGAGAGGPATEVVFRILCPSGKTGAIIGKGGSIVKLLREETGARIKIADAVGGVDERVVIISGTEVQGSDYSPAQQALFRVQTRLLEPECNEPGGTTTTTRLLVPTSQIGCLLGKGGSIISEMRRSSHAHIRILPRNELPGCALETDELVQIVGDLNAARSAVHQVSSRLRLNPPKDRPAFSGAAAPPPLHNDPNDMMLPPPLPMLLPGLPQQQQQAMGGLPLMGHDMGPSGGMSTISSSSTVHVAIPVQTIGSIIGKAGTNIAQIRNISGARVKLHEAGENAAERVVEINGTPDQVQAAQSLLQAFIISGQAAVTSSPAF